MPTFEEKIRALGGIELHRPKAAPDVAPANSARVYYDADQGALQVSNNGGAYSSFADLTAAGVTATATEINKLHSVVAGTSSASKAAVLGTNKNLDILALPVSGLKIGAGAGTAVDATAAELNKTAGVTAGTVTASKALVVDANSRLDAVCVGTLSLGAGAGTALTATAAQMNQIDAAFGTVTFSRATKWAKVALAGAADTGGGVGAWVNPEATAIAVLRVLVDVTTIAASACKIDVGTTTANATTLSDNLIDGVDVHSATGLFDLADGDGVNGKPKQRLASGKWVTFSTVSGGAAASLVGSAYIEYVLL